MFAFSDALAGLTLAQREVAEHGDEPLVVVAGAGTGKTRTLVARVAGLLARGVAPERILLLTFTRRAADDMVARAAALTGQGQVPFGGTFHAVAYRVLAARAAEIGLVPGFGVLDPGEASDLMDLMRGEVGLAGTAVRFPRPATLVALYSRCVNRGQPLDVVVPAEFPWITPHLEAVAALFTAYTARKRATGVLDFDDLLLYWRAVLDATTGAPAFEHVLVDEYQDVNRLQVDIVSRLAPAGRGLTVVGDEAQAIYGFRGADSRHLRELVAALHGARVVRLEDNFRSRRPVVEVANVVRPTQDGAALRLRSTRGEGPPVRLVQCYDAAGEARAIVDDILRGHEDGVPLREQAILVRAGHHSDLIEVELSSRHVPYRKYGGLRFLEAAHVRDFVAAARLLDNPRDEVAWYRLLRLHPGIGAAHARHLLAAGDVARGDALAAGANLVALAPASVRQGLAATLGALAQAREGVGAGARADGVLSAVAPLVRARYPDAAARLGDLERLVDAAHAHERLSDWLAEVVLDPPASTGDLAGPPVLDEDYVVVSTIHSAKGLEWSHVHIPHVVDGIIPLDMSLGTPDGLAEERRLFYVAVTRARDELSLYAPLRLPYHRHAGDDRHGWAPLSRFVDDAVRAVVRVQEVEPARRALTVAVTGPVVVDLDDLWRVASPMSLEDPT